MEDAHFELTRDFFAVPDGKVHGQQFFAGDLIPANGDLAKAAAAEGCLGKQDAKQVKDRIAREKKAERSAEAAQARTQKAAETMAAGLQNRIETLTQENADLRATIAEKDDQIAILTKPSGFEDQTTDGTGAKEPDSPADDTDVERAGRDASGVTPQDGTREPGKTAPENKAATVPDNT